MADFTLADFLQDRHRAPSGGDSLYDSRPPFIGNPLTAPPGTSLVNQSLDQIDSPHPLHPRLMPQSQTERDAGHWRNTLPWLSFIPPIGAFVGGQQLAEGVDTGDWTQAGMGLAGIGLSGVGGNALLPKSVPRAASAPVDYSALSPAEAYSLARQYGHSNMLARALQGGQLQTMDDILARVPQRVIDDTVARRPPAPGPWNTPNLMDDFMRRRAQPPR